MGLNGIPIDRLIDETPAQRSIKFQSVSCLNGQV